MKRSWSLLSLLALAALLVMCTPKKNKTASDPASSESPELYPSPTSPSGDTTGAQVHVGDPVAPEDSLRAGADVRQSTQPRSQPPRHGSPEQETVDSIKAAKTKRKKQD